MQPFFDAYGFVAADEVLRYVALLLNEVVFENGTSQDFIGQAGGTIFVLITYSEEPSLIITKMRDRFRKEIKTHYGFADAERGGIEQPDGSVSSLMTLSVGSVSEANHKFADIREITEVAAAERRYDIDRTV
jgi:GGDEF domain-containing protein